MIEYQSTLTPIQTAKYVGISEAALRLWRFEGKGPRHFKAGEKLVHYRRADLDSWIEIHLSSGWRRSGHKIWVQISSLDLGDFSIHGRVATVPGEKLSSPIADGCPPVSILRPGRPRTSPRECGADSERLGHPSERAVDRPKVRPRHSQTGRD